MNRGKRLGVAFLIAAVMSAGLSSARLEAKGGGGGGGGAICASLLAIINNTSLSPAIRKAAQYTYDAFGCGS